MRLAPGLGWRLVQVAADFTTLFLSAMAAYGLYLASGLGRQDYDPLFYAQLNLALAIVTVFALVGFGGYRESMGLLRIEAVRRIILGVTSGLALTLVLSILLKFPAFSRLTMLILAPVMILALVGQRMALWHLQSRLKMFRRYAKPVLIYGAGETGRVLAQHLLEDLHLGLAPVGFLDDNPALQGSHVRVSPGVDGLRLPVIGDEAALPDALARTEATAVFVAIPSAPRRIAELVSKLAKLQVSYFFVPSAGELVLAGLQFGQVAGMPVFTSRIQRADRAYSIIKRGIDLLVASVLLVLSLPLLAVAAAALKLSSRGPAVFSQKRCGLNGKPFTIYKLRTMWADSPKYAQTPNHADDARITPLGRWLRRLSIDELPQLWNVIQGDMSLVGPRPEMPGVVAGYSSVQRQRLTMKPGVTGLWQISADRAFLIHDNIHYDLYYMENRSTTLDLAVLVMTPLVVFFPNGAV